MRSALAVLVIVGALPLAAQKTDPLAFLRRTSDQDDISFINYKNQPYSPMRTGAALIVGAAGLVAQALDRLVER